MYTLPLWEPWNLKDAKMMHCYCSGSERLCTKNLLTSVAVPNVRKFARAGLHLTQLSAYRELNAGMGDNRGHTTTVTVLPEGRYVSCTLVLANYGNRCLVLSQALHHPRFRSSHHVTHHLCCCLYCLFIHTCTYSCWLCNTALLVFQAGLVS